jgi:hypothetical protein
MDDHARDQVLVARLAILPLSWTSGAPRGIRTPNRQIRRLVLYVDLVGSRRIWPAHVAGLVDLVGSRQVPSDRLDDQAAGRRDPRSPRPRRPLVERAPDIPSGDGCRLPHGCHDNRLESRPHVARCCRAPAAWRHRHGGVDQPGRLGPRTRPVSRARAAASRARPSTTMSESPVPLISSRLRSESSPR